MRALYCIRDVATCARKLGTQSTEYSVYNEYMYILYIYYMSIIISSCGCLGILCAEQTLNALAQASVLLLFSIHVFGMPSEPSWRLCPTCGLPWEKVKENFRSRSYRHSDLG